MYPIIAASVHAENAVYRRRHLVQSCTSCTTDTSCTTATCYRRVNKEWTTLSVLDRPCIEYSTLTTLTTCQQLRFLGEKKGSECYDNHCWAKVRAMCGIPIVV